MSKLYYVEYMPEPANGEVYASYIEVTNLSTIVEYSFDLNQIGEDIFTITTYRSWEHYWSSFNFGADEFMQNGIMLLVNE